MADHLLDFDYFVFAEEDMVLTYSHLRAFVFEQNKLKKSLPDSQWLRYQIGFLRCDKAIMYCIVLHCRSQLLWLLIR